MLNFQPPELDRLTQWMITRSRRSWWQVKYESGKIISEWNTLQFTKLFSPLGPSPTSRWEEIAKLDIRGLYLLCPNGRSAALEGNGAHTFFQLKVGFADSGAGLGQASFLKAPQRYCSAHIIGKVDREDGHCVCFAYELQETAFSQWECKLCGGFGSKKAICPRCMVPTTRMNPIRFEDNVTNLAYENIGAIALGHHTGIM